MLIHGWKRGLLIGEKPSKNTGSGSRSRQDEATQVLLEVYGGKDSANGVTVTSSYSLLYFLFFILSL